MPLTGTMSALEAFDTIRIDAGNPGQMTGAGNRTYLIVNAMGGAALVDAGVGQSDHLAAIESHVIERGAHLDLVLVTHAHGDHAGGVAAIAARFPNVRFAKYPWPDEDHRYPVPWNPIADNDTLVVAGQPLEVIHTPGHTPDHVAFYHRPSGTAWTGDLVTQDGSVMIHWSHGGDMADYMRSLHRLMALRPVRILPAHGPDVSDPHVLLRQVVEHRLLRERQILEKVARNRSTVQAIAESIYHDLDTALSSAALENVLAHLVKLRDEGQVINRDGRWYRA